MAQPIPINRDQLAMDEKVIQDPDLEAALEERLKRKNSRDALQKEYADADAKAKGLIEGLELPDGHAARVGRFRIARSALAARTVSFETKPSSRLTIDVVSEE